MQLNEVLQGKPTYTHPIITECCDFLEESHRLPVLKNLPQRYDNVHRVKVRQRKKRDDFTQTFNEAFHVQNLRQRSVTVNGEVSFLAEGDAKEPFYVFPVNGYKYQYSLEVSNSKQDYQEAFDAILDLCENAEIMEQLLKYTYTSQDLHEGISHGSEVIFYNMPHFYAAKVSKYQDYTDLLEDLQEWTT